MKKRVILTSGLAMFSMFFGSGNLVFPLKLGTSTGASFGWGFVGILLTGILVPFLGILSMLRFGGDRARYFAVLGKPVGFIITFLMLALMGPFGVGARCIIVSHGGMNLIFPNLPLWLFSFVFCIITSLIAWRSHRVVSILGKVLTPMLLLALIILIIGGSTHNNAAAPFSIPAHEAFSRGISEGYQTMDLLAAFFFSSTIILYMKERLAKEKQMYAGFLAGTFGVFLLSAVYGGFVFLGGKYAAVMKDVPAEQILVSIAHIVFGPLAAPIMAVTICLACLTTLAVLTSLFAQFLTKDILKGKHSDAWGLVVTIVVTFCMSLLGFDKLAHWIAYSLQIAYPALIVLSVVYFSDTLVRYARPLFYIVLLYSLFIAYFI